MDTALNLSPSAVLATTAGTVIDRAITRKVTPIDTNDRETTRPAEKPFVAQVVNARLSGADYPENPSEIAPPERTLRPYDVPMLPSSPISESDLIAKEPERDDP